MYEVDYSNRHSFSKLKDIQDLLFGRHIVSIENNVPTPSYSVSHMAVMTLDNGQKLGLIPNYGGCCGAGDYFLDYFAGDEALNARITGVKLKNKPVKDEKIYDKEMFTLFILAEDKKIKLAEVSGSEGNGYYGRGFSVAVVYLDEDSK